MLIKCTICLCVICQKLLSITFQPEKKYYFGCTQMWGSDCFCWSLLFRSWWLSKRLLFGIIYTPLYFSWKAVTRFFIFGKGTLHHWLPVSRTFCTTNFLHVFQAVRWELHSNGNQVLSKVYAVVQYFSPRNGSLDFLEASWNYLPLSSQGGIVLSVCLTSWSTSQLPYNQESDNDRLKASCLWIVWIWVRLF